MTALQPHDFVLGNGSVHRVEKGSLLVTEDRRAGSGEIRLDFLRIPCPVPGAPTIVFLAGGPGDSGVQWATHPPFWSAFERVSTRAHVVLLDQRGCGTSERGMPLAPPALERDSLVDEDSFRDALFGWLRGQRERFRGAPLGAYTVEDSADDLPDLADALGVEKVALWGYSYGSHLAQAAMRRHPGRVSRVVMCGFEGPDHTLKMPANVQAQLVKLDALAREQGVTKDLLGRMERVHAKLAREPMEVAHPLAPSPAVVRVGAHALQHLASTWMGVSNRFVALPALYASIEAGDSQPLAKALSGFAKTWRRPLVFYLKDGASSASPERLALIEQQKGGCLLANAVNFPFSEVAEVVGARDLGSEFRQPVQSEIPTLILTGTLDGNTPTEQALEGMRSLSNSSHILVRNAAHNDLLLSSEAVDAIARFVSGEPPALAEAQIPVPTFVTPA